MFPNSATLYINPIQQFFLSGNKDKGPFPGLVNMICLPFFLSRFISLTLGFLSATLLD